MPCCTRSRARNPAMSGSSSTTRTRNAACAALAVRPAARLLIDDLYARQVVGVFRQAGAQPVAVAGLRAILDLLAEQRHFFKAIGVADALHAVAELAHLLEVV